MRYQRRSLRVLTVALTAGFGLVATGTVPAGAQVTPVTVLVDRNTAGQQAANGVTYWPAISSERIIAFQSSATNLVPGDTGTFNDVFVRYQGVPMTVRASVGIGGALPNGESDVPSIDGNARHVAFRSFATNLVSRDLNGAADIFVRTDPALSTATTTRISIPDGGGEADGSSSIPRIDPTGRYVAFTSRATNLVPGDTNGVQDIFVRDLVAGTTRRVSLGSGGTQANGPSFQPAISNGGRFIAFTSNATNMVPDDTNAQTDVFVYDTATGGTARVNVSSTGEQANGPSALPSIKAIGGDVNRSRYWVAYESMATNLVPGDTNTTSDVFVADTGIYAPPAPVPTTTRVSVSSSGRQANGPSAQPVIAAGSGVTMVAFTSAATNLVSLDTNQHNDIFRRVLDQGLTERRSVAGGGAQAIGGDSVLPEMDPSGHVAYVSAATNLVPGDANATDDIFVTTDQ